MVSLIKRWVGSRYFILTFLLVVVITHFPTGKGQILGDDFVHWANLTAPEGLAEQGFTTIKPENSLWERVSLSFAFLSNTTDVSKDLDALGYLPWWVGDSVSMHMFRPLASLTHWFDYNFLGRDIVLMQLHTVMYLCFFALSLYWLFRRLGLPGWVPALAMSFIVYSYTMPPNIGWLAGRNAIMAPIFVVLALGFHHEWRTQQRSLFAVLSCLAVMFAVLSAEAGIACLAYIGAYSLLVDKGKLIPRLSTVLPALAVVVLWRWFYSTQGFGANNIDLYVDPAHSPWQFVTERIPMFGMFWGRLILGPIYHGLHLITLNEMVISIICLVIAVLFFGVFWRQIKASALMQFGLFSMALAAIPFLSTNPGPRSEPILQIGFFITVSLIYWNVFTGDSSRRIRIFLIGFLIYHLAIPATVTTARHLRLITLEAYTGDSYDEIAETFAEQPTDLVLVNPPNYYSYYYRPYQWVFNGHTLPAHVYQLAPGLEGMTLKRVSEFQYTLTCEQGCPVRSNRPAGIDKRVDPDNNRVSALLFRANNQIMTYFKSEFKADDHYSSGTMRVSFLDMAGDQPKTLQLSFDPTRKTPQLWRWYNWAKGSFETMKPLAVGEQRYFRGPFK